MNEEEFEEAYNSATKYIKKMSSTIDDFRNFFAKDKQKKRFMVHDVILNTIELIEATFAHHHIEISTELDENMECFGFPNELSQVLLNLLNNSKDAILERKIKGGHLTIRLENRDNLLRLTASDNGGGISPEIMEKIFDPYFSTKHDKQGTGIGLYMSKTIIVEHMSGNITAENYADGARFIITVPRESCQFNEN